MNSPPNRNVLLQSYLSVSPVEPKSYVLTKPMTPKNKEDKSNIHHQPQYYLDQADEFGDNMNI